MFLSSVDGMNQENPAGGIGANLRPGGAIVRIQAAPVLSFMKKIFSGELGYRMATPWIPGANGVGVVESVADDLIGVKPGDLVFIDPHIFTNTTTNTYDGILLGLTSLSPDSGALYQRWRNGTFAEKALVPGECLTRLSGAEKLGPVRLSILSFAAIAYGGLLKGSLRPGQVLIVSGATGNIGSTAVLVGLAMGAERIVALGREKVILTQLKEIEPNRIKTVKLQGALETDKHAIAAAADGADLVYDMLGSAPTFEPTAAAIYALRKVGTAVLMGGVQAAMNLPYAHVMQNELSIKGALMYPRSAPAELVRLIAAGLLELVQTAALDVVGCQLRHHRDAR